MILKRALLILGIFYLLYVGAVAVVLNTPLFAKLTEMDNEELTHVGFSGAFSPFPGYLYSRHGKVVIKDQNVSIDIRLKGVWAKFDLLPIKKLRLEVTSLRIKEASVDLGMKDIQQTVAYLEKYTRKDSVDRSLRKEIVEEFRKKHLTLNFQKILIDDLNQIKSGLGDFKGHLSLDGKFEIQPGVQVEVYPTRLTFHSGELPGQFSKVSGQADVTFDRFQIFESPGNAVFPHFNAKLSLDLDMQSLEMLDLTLRSMQGFSFGKSDPSHLRVRVEAVKGELQRGSFIETDPSRMTIQSDSLVAKGDGKIEWKVDQPHTSSLKTSLTKVALTDPRRTTWAGSVDSLKLNLTLFENNLLHAFQGAALDLNVQGLRWDVKSDEETKKNLQYQGMMRGKGQLYGVSGILPKPAEKIWKAKQSDFNLSLEKIKVISTFLPPVDVNGKVRVSAYPIDLGTRSIQMPKLETDLKIKVGKHGTVESQIKVAHAEYLLAPAEKWKGQIDLHLDKTDPFVDAFRERDQISAILATAARVNHLKGKMDWEMGKAYSWFRVSEISSSGVWKAYGSLANEPQGMSGAFETIVLGVPVGIKIEPEKTNIKALPGSDWYDAKADTKPTP